MNCADSTMYIVFVRERERDRDREGERLREGQGERVGRGLGRMPSITFILHLLSEVQCAIFLPYRERRNLHKYVRNKFSMVKSSRGRWFTPQTKEN